VLNDWQIAALVQTRDPVASPSTLVNVTRLACA